MPARVPANQWEGTVVRLDPASNSVTLRPNEIPKHDTLVLAARDMGGDHVEVGISMVRGPAPACSNLS
jgi:hypothetical protein